MECDKLIDHTIICGDLNGKSPTWSSPHSPTPSNPEGERIEQALLRSTFTCLNDGSSTWNSQDLSVCSTLDLTFVSPTLATHCIWYVFDFNYGSDHFPIVIPFSLNISKKIGCRPHISMGKINWKLFKNNLELYLDDTTPINTNQALQRYKTLTDNIYLALSEAGAKIKNTKTKVYKRRPQISWWDDICNDTLKEKARKFKEYKTHPTIENLNTYLEISKKVNKQIKKIKLEKFKKFCDSLSPMSNISEVWSKIRGFRCAAANRSSPPPSEILSTNNPALIDTITKLTTPITITSQCHVNPSFPLHIIHNPTCCIPSPSPSLSSPLSINKCYYNNKK